MMNKKLDLNNYLSKYIGAHTDNPNNNRPSESRVTAQPQPQHQQLRSIAPTTTTHTHYSMGFHKAQVECLQELQQVKRSLQQSEKQIGYFLNNYQKRVAENLHKQHYRIREQILELFERAFEANERRIDESLATFSSNQPQQFTNIRKRISMINQDIMRLEQGLRSQNYRPVIAEVVTSDFDAVTRELQGVIAQAEKTVYERSVKLRVNQQSIMRLQEEVLNAVVLEGGGGYGSRDGRDGYTTQQQQQVIPEAKKSMKSKLPLFDKEPSEKGSFFNFK